MTYLTKYDIAGIIATAIAFSVIFAGHVWLWIAENRTSQGKRADEVKP